MSDIIKRKAGEVAAPQSDINGMAVTEGSTDIFLYLGILRKRKWIVLASLVVVLAATCGRIYLSTPLYRATARIQIEPEAKILPYQDSSAVVNADYIATQCEILRSDTLARRVAARLGPEQTPEELASKAGWVRSNVSVLPMPGTMVVKLSFDATNPALAARVVNVLTDEYIDHHFESKYQSSAMTRGVLQSELDGLKTKVEKSERELVDYALQNNQALLSDPIDNVVQRRLTDLNGQLNQVDKELLANRYQDVQKAPNAPLPKSLQSLELKELELRQAQLSDELAALSQQFGPKWPEVKRVGRELSLAKARVKEEQKSIVREAKLEYELLRGHRERLMAAVRNQNQQVLRLNKDSIYFSILKREAETDQQLYDALLQSYKEATISAGLRTVNIRVIDRAQVPGRPYSPNIPINVALGCGLGLIAGVTFAFSLESLDTTLTTPGQVYKDLGLATLGIIPQMAAQSSFRRDANGLQQYRGRNDSHNGRGDSPTLGLLAPAKAQELEQELPTLLPADSAEGYRGLRTRLLLAPELRTVQTLVVTSALPGEGKSTTCANLAASLAGLRARTLILELDLRNPRLKRHFDVDHHHDLTDYISGKCPLSDIVNPTSTPDLFVAFAGSWLGDPSELISSHRIDEALQELSKDFSYILVDAPPILPVSDAMVLACKVDGVVLVIRSGRTSRADVQEARERVSQVGARILGAVINGADTAGSVYQYGSAYGGEQAAPDVPASNLFRKGRQA